MDKEDDTTLRNKLREIYPQLKFSIIWGHNQHTRKRHASIYLEGPPMSSIDIMYICNCLKKQNFSHHFTVVGHEDRHDGLKETE